MMRHGGPTEADRSTRVLFTLGVSALTLLTGSIGYAVATHLSTGPLRDEAHREAVRRAAAIGADLIAGPTDDPVELGRLLAGASDVEVLSVEGRDRRHSPGVRITFRVRVEVGRRVLGGSTSLALDVCFRQILDRENEDHTRYEIPCPTFGPSPGPSEASTPPAE